MIIINKDVVISLHGVRTGDDKADEVIELVTSGKYCANDSGYVITYPESELTGLEGTTTTLKVEDSKITLTREGKTVSQMVFEEGRKHFSLYETMYGSMMVGISAQKVKSTLDEKGGSIQIDYTIDIDHAMTGTNTFIINVREADSSVFKS